SPARHRGRGYRDDVEEELGLVLGDLALKAAPEELVLAVADQAAAEAFRGRQVDPGAGRIGGTEGKAGELQACRRRLGDVADDIERIIALLGVLLLVENLQSIVDVADRTDQVVADLAGDQGGELEIAGLDALVHQKGPLLGVNATKPAAEI